MRLTADELHGKIGPAMPALTLLGSPERGRWLLVRGARRGGVEGHLVESGDESRVRLGRRALRGALARHGNLEIAAGGRVLVAGGGGDGKSGLLDLCFGLRRPTHGQVEIDGVDLRSSRPLTEPGCAPAWPSTASWRRSRPSTPPRPGRGRYLRRRGRLHRRHR